MRQAFFYAIDIEKLIKNAMNGHAAAVTSFLPKNHANYHEASTIYTYDPEKAKSLLEEAGATGMSFELMVNNNWVKNLSAQIKNDLDAVGINTTLQVEAIQWASLAESDDISTLVFDEVDTGVSGRAAQKVAEKLAQVSRRKQVLCVTHLPQLAAMADTHFSVEKGEERKNLYTRCAA